MRIAIWFLGNELFALDLERQPAAEADDEPADRQTRVTLGLDSEISDVEEPLELHEREGFGFR